jgi:hypothetical protein
MAKNTRPDLEMALHTMTHPRKKELAKDEKKSEHEEKKEFHVTRLHDGTFHHVLHDGMERDKEGSTADLDDVHDRLEEAYRTPNDGEQEGQEKRYVSTN